MAFFLRRKPRINLLNSAHSFFIQPDAKTKPKSFEFREQISECDLTSFQLQQCCICIVLRKHDVFSKNQTTNYFTVGSFISTGTRKCFIQAHYECIIQYKQCECTASTITQQPNTLSLMYDTGHKTTNLAKQFILITTLLMNVNRKIDI